MIQMNKYDMVLKMFTGHADNTPEWQEEPRPHGVFIIATNTRILMRIKREMCERQYHAHSYQPTAFDRIFPQPNCELILSVEECAAAINKIPGFERIAVSGVDAKCDECDGSGEVEWTYESHDGEDFTEYHDCPICDGKGKFTHKDFPRDKRNVGINDVKFNAGYLMTVLEAIHKLGHKNATVTYLNAGHPMLINVEPGVDILIMSNDMMKPATSITLKSSDK